MRFVFSSFKFSCHARPRAGIRIPAQGGDDGARKIFSFFVMLAGLLLLPAAAHATCTDPAGTAGEMVYNEDYRVPQVCTQGNWVALGPLNPAAGGTECSNPAGVPGEIIYNTDIHKPQYCDGDDWVVMTGRMGENCKPPASCASVGDICNDGSIFAGFMVYNNSSCEALFVTDAYQSLSSQWKTSSGITDIPSGSRIDGRINHQNREGSLSDFPAFELCEDNTYHSNSDWYLPAAEEMALLWLNRDAINVSSSENFINDRHWTSSEFSSDHGHHVSFPEGDVRGDRTKTNNEAVRCVRRN